MEKTETKKTNRSDKKKAILTKASFARFCKSALAGADGLLGVKTPTQCGRDVYEAIQKILLLYLGKRIRNAVTVARTIRGASTLHAADFNVPGAENDPN